MKSEKGFTLIEGIFIVIFIAIIGAVGYFYIHVVTPKTNDVGTIVSPNAGPIKIESKSDLDVASSALNGIQLNDSDGSQFDSAANSFN